MNGAACVEAECCEYVEVDPTGRYGRVYILSLLLTHPQNLCFFLIYDMCWVCCYLLDN